jgi:hypothetical protein
MRLVTAPPVYDPGGNVAFVSDLATEDYLTSLMNEASKQGAVLMVVGAKPGSPQEVELADTGFTMASEWYRTQLPLASPAPTLALRPLRVDDLPGVAEIAQACRLQYAHYQPVFWRVHPNAVENHTAFLKTQLARTDACALACVDSEDRLSGYVFVDHRGIDDFGVHEPTLWKTVGKALLDGAAAWMGAQSLSEITVVCGHKDRPKRAMLQATGLYCCDGWWTLPLMG